MCKGATAVLDLRKGNFGILSEKSQAVVETLPAPRLSLSRYRLVFAPSRPLSLRGYEGSAWRGLFGHALRRLVCVSQDRECPACLLYRSCVYTYIFDTPPRSDATKLRKYAAVPHPYALDVPLERTLGADRYELTLTLMGRGNNYLAYVIHALRSAGAKGLRNQPSMRLAEIEQELNVGSGQWQSIVEGENGLRPFTPQVVTVPDEIPAKVRIEIRTPLRLRRQNRYVTPESFQFSDLFGSLLRRISALMEFHTETSLETDFGGLSRLSREVRLLSKSLEWRDWTRFSSRQQTHLKMGGLIGGMELDSAGLRPFWPYLWLGQWTHAGKGAVMGLGSYRLSGDEESGEGDGFNGKAAL